jgi:hypothetical protein
MNIHDAAIRNRAGLGSVPMPPLPYEQGAYLVEPYRQRAVVRDRRLLAACCGMAKVAGRPAADDRLIELSVLNRTRTLDAVLSSTFGPHSKRSAAHR